MNFKFQIAYTITLVRNKKINPWYKKKLEKFLRFSMIMHHKLNVFHFYISKKNNISIYVLYVFLKIINRNYIRLKSHLSIIIVRKKLLKNLTLFQ